VICDSVFTAQFNVANSSSPKNENYIVLNCTAQKPGLHGFFYKTFSDGRYRVRQFSPSTMKIPNGRLIVLLVYQVMVLTQANMHRFQYDPYNYFCINDESDCKNWKAGYKRSGGAYEFLNENETISLVIQSVDTEKIYVEYKVTHEM
jgi:hypothetical protein